MHDLSDVQGRLYFNQKEILEVQEKSMARLHESSAFFTQLEGSIADLTAELAPLVERVGPTLQALNIFFGTKNYIKFCIVIASSAASCLMLLLGLKRHAAILISLGGKLP